MKISNVNVEICDKDLLSIVSDIINEFVKVDGLSIHNIDIHDFIEVKGKYKKGITIPFMVSLIIEDISDNKIKIKIDRVKVLRIGIFRGLVNFILKAVLKGLDKIGIKCDRNNLYIDLKLLSPIIPYVDFEVISIDMVQGGLKVCVNNINYSQNKQAKDFDSILKEHRDYSDVSEDDEIKLIELNGSGEKSKEKTNDEEKIERIDVKDGYTKLRKDIQHRIPEKYDSITEYALIIPDLAALLYRLFKDRRVSLKIKLTVGAVLAYVAVPIDIIPEGIPVIGKIDDIAIMFFGLDKIINEVPEEVILDNWQGEEDIITIIKEGISVISNAVGGKKVAKIMNLIERRVYKRK
jgi:uncharacterized membrane protein YkvA (DUF1232 family)